MTDLRKPGPSEIPEFDRVMRGLVNVDPAEIEDEGEAPPEEGPEDAESE